MDSGQIVGTAIGIAFGVAVPATVAIVKLFPAIRAESKSQHATICLAGGLQGIIERQTEILERMERSQDKILDSQNDINATLQIMYALDQRLRGKPQ